MKVLASIIGYIMIIFVQVLAIAYFSSIWGGIGFFGALMTMPLSGFVYAIIGLFSSLAGFIGWVIYLTIAVVLIGSGDE
jgi:hypothetical protein